MMNTEILRALWSSVASLSPDNVTELPYESLVQKIIQQLSDTLCLSLEEKSQASSYLRAREALVYDMLSQ